MDFDFEELYIVWYARLKHFACAYVMSESDAEDIVQDVFMRIYEHKKDIAGHGKAVSYLFSSIKHACLNHLRDKLAADTAVSALRDRYHLEMQLRYDSLEHAGVGYQRDEDIEEALNRALETLPEKCRQIFVMNKLQGIKQSEIAERLNITVNTVESQMGIAYRKLRRELKDYIPLLFLLFCA